MISSTAEYALRAVVFLATKGDGARTAHQIAAATRTPAGYVSKVLQDLARSGVVVSQRGPNGGFSLVRPADQVSVLDVMNAVDPIRRIHTCPLKIPSHGPRLCRLHQRLDDALATIEATFASTTIAELLEPGRSGTRCLFPAPPHPMNRPGSSRGGGA